MIHTTAFSSLLIIENTPTIAHDIVRKIRAYDLLKSHACHCVTENDALLFFKSIASENTLPGALLINVQATQLDTLISAIHEFLPDCELLFYDASNAIGFNTKTQFLLKGLHWKIIALDSPELPLQITSAVQSSLQRSQLRSSLKRANTQLSSFRNKDARQRLEEIEKQLAFNLNLTNRIRDISTEQEILVATCDLLGIFLHPSRIIYCDVNDASNFLITYEWLDKGQVSINHEADKYSAVYSEIITRLSSDKVIAIDDVSINKHADFFKSIDVHSVLFVPLLKANQLMAVVIVQHSEIFQWTDDYITLVKDTAERTWAVVEKARAQVVIDAQRNRIEHVFDSMSEGFAIIDNDWQVLDMNAEGLRIGQRTAQDVIGKNLWEVWPEIIGTDIETRYRAVMNSRQRDIIEQRVAFSNGNTFWLEISLHPILHGGMTALFRDVSRRKNIEMALQESERRAVQAAKDAETERRLLNALLDAVPVGIGMADNTGNLIRHNRANKKLWGGYLPESKSVDEYIEWKGWWADGSERHGRRIEPHEWALARALNGDYASQDIVEIETFDTPPKRRVITLSAGPVHDAQGNIVGGVVAQTDITHQTIAEAALRESEAKFRTITNAMPQMIWSTLRDGSRDYFNQQWYDFTGLPAGSLDGEQWNNVVHPDDHERTFALWHQSLANGKHFEYEYRLRHISGNFRWVLARAVPVTDDDGVIVRWMGSCTDIHDQKLAQDALRVADRRKDEFLAMLAHELRNPLAPISAAADLLQMATVDVNQVKKTSAIISRQVKHMTSLVDDLLDVSRVTRGLISLESNVIDVAVIVTNAVEQVRPLIESRRHNLIIQLPPKARFIQGDSKRLIQVITNVLNNAAKYTPDGGRIELLVNANNEHVVFQVRDNGIGMTEDTVQQVFELFVQAERSPDRTIGGLGIGLALVKSLVEYHHGEVSAHSAGLNKGSEFSITLPQVFQKITAATLDMNETLSTHNKKLRVLIVDDNADAADVLAMLLEFSGYHVMTERHAKGAIENIKLQAPDICLLDIGLPDMDGNELAQYLRLQPETEKAVLIAVTGYGQDEDRKKTSSAGFDYHFVKPVDTHKLISFLDKLDIKHR